MAEARTLTVQTASGEYDVVVADGMAGLGRRVSDLAAGRRPIVVTDDHVGPLWLKHLLEEVPDLGDRVITVPAGETNKHRDTWWSIVDGLLRLGVDRKTPVVALGGGVVGDLVGFAAASVLRGVPLVQVPTTLLAMVDSSVGGKTGFNHPRGKNLVGAFHRPHLVWAALDTLSTLSARERIAGLGEVVKTALLGDAELFGELERNAPALRRGDADVLADVVCRCVRLKAEVVSADEREAGWRAVLNLGHTVGHAVEVVGGYGRWLHGEAVAIGLVAEARWAVARGHCSDPGLPERLVVLLSSLGLPAEVPRDLARDALATAMRLDKKVGKDMIVIPVPLRVGGARLVEIKLDRVSELLGDRQ